MRKKSKKKWIFISIIIVLVIVVSVVYSIQKSKKKGEEVIIATVKKRDLSSTVSGTGKINPVSQVKISTNLNTQIKKLYVREGDIVEAGQKLVSLDRKPYITAVSRARANLNSAQSSYRRSLMDYSRNNQLFARGMVSQQVVDQSRAEIETTGSSVEVAKANLQDAIRNLSEADIVAPMSGIITALNKEEGEMCKGVYSEDIIMIISKMEKVEVVLDINENDIINLKVGQSALIKLDALPDTVFNGIVSSIAETGTAKGTTAGTSTSATRDEVSYFEVKVEVLEKIPGLKPGMSTGVDIITETRKNVISVPIQAVIMQSAEKDEEDIQKQKDDSSQKKEGDITEKKTTERLAKQEKYKTIIYLYKANQAISKAIRTGLSSDIYMEVTEGLAEGDTIITGPFKVLRKIKNKDNVFIYSSKKDRGKSSRKEE
ncbi:MAG: efflux RND transporter periplasmic adaptor subunit [Candidatus Coatesbacteria bacterium]|nr:efflux RND transporter periplasmic adaptor subunit [Candidatus Coatesbacteria bacterium]